MGLLIIAMAWALTIGPLCTTGLTQGLAELFEQGRYVAARKACAEHLAANPDDPEALYYMGRLSMDGAGARGHFERLLAANRTHALADDAQLELAELTFAGPYGLYPKARGQFAALLRNHPDSPHAAQALLRIGQSYLIEGRQDSASAYFSAAADAGNEGGPVQEVVSGLQARTHGPAPPLVSTTASMVTGVTRRTWVQVGAFAVEQNATKLLGQLRSGGIPGEVLDATARGLHLVFAGPFPDRDAAEKAVSRIQKSTGIQGRIVVRR